MRQENTSARSYNIPIFIPHEGCPHDCTFCNQRKITGLTTSMTPEAVRESTAEGLRHLKDRKGAHIEVAFFGGSFTGLPLSAQENFLKSVQEFFPQIDGIRVSTRPDYITEETAALLKRYGVKTVELGVQSSDDSVLCANRRGHTFSDVKSAVPVLRKFGFSVGLQMMAGMYRSTPEKDERTAEDLIALHPDCVRIYPTVILCGTALEALYRNGKYSPYSLEQAVDVCKRIVLRFRAEKVPIIRLGLHAGEDLREDGTIVDGPFHPAFGELVESRIWRDKLEAECKERQLRGAVLNVFCGRREVSAVVGHRGCNREYLKKVYGVLLKPHITDRANMQGMEKASAALDKKGF